MKPWKWIVWFIALVWFVFMWYHWGFDEMANIVNNLSYPAMVFAFIAWVDHMHLRKRMHKRLENLEHSLQHLHVNHERIETKIDNIQGERK